MKLRTFTFVSSLLTFVSAASGAPMLHCELGATLDINGKSHQKCQIVGHSEAGAAKTFYASCEGKNEDSQIEYQQGSPTAQLVDATSREERAKCAVDEKQVNAMIKNYQAMGEELENPKCYLTQWKGQMMVVAEGAKGRCSFTMNKNKSEEFKTKTGVTPLYQCENDTFLSVAEKTAASVYKKSKSGWELECKATIRTGEPVDAIDWKNPPQYWAPEAEEPGPKDEHVSGLASTHF